VYAARWGYGDWRRGDRSDWRDHHDNVDGIGCDQARGHGGTDGCGSEGRGDNASEGCHACGYDDPEADDAARDHAALKHAAQTFEPVRITCVA
jgi:hypothetical protein